MIELLRDRLVAAMFVEMEMIVGRDVSIRRRHYSAMVEDTMPRTNSIYKRKKRILYVDSWLEVVSRANSRTFLSVNRHERSCV